MPAALGNGLVGLAKYLVRQHLVHRRTRQIPVGQLLAAVERQDHIRAVEDVSLRAHAHNRPADQVIEHVVGVGNRLERLFAATCGEPVRERLQKQSISPWRYCQYAPASCQLRQVGFEGRGLVAAEKPTCRDTGG